MADWGSLENCCTFARTVGSNPTLSANFYRDNFLRRPGGTDETPVSTRFTDQSC